MSSKRRALVTGATNGIGLAIAERLALGGFDVTIHGRSDDRLAAARARIAERVPGSDPRTERADFAILDDVRSLAGRLTAGPRLDVVIANAAVIAPVGDRASDGMRRTVVVNHLAPYLLLRLVAGQMTGDDARIVIVGAEPEALAARPVDVDDLNALPFAGIPEPLVPFALYGLTKNMNAMTTYALSRRLEPSGITVNGAHPGILSGTGLAREVPDTSAAVKELYGVPEDRPPAEEGAVTPVWLATEPSLKGTTGRFFVDRQAVTTAGHTTDPERCDQLWNTSAKLVGLEP
jgi:NAD(P)-dependent dehydrogenase (short-subunit alcohol dehydrogenase family)